VQAGRASRTAELIAMYRALHLELCKDPLLVDPWAAQMISRPLRIGVQSRLFRSFYLRFVNDLRPAMMSFMVRSRIAEDLFAAKSGLGTVQWVLLGAGLDTFAWRHPEHAELTQFEVDHRDTQTYKRDRLAKLGLSSPAKHRFVTVDFERERISDALRAAGFDPATPAVFAWLGVTYYLTREAIVATLQDVATIAAPGSAIVCD
jgi:methyltransferase (TIGR00027 family)